MPFQHALDLLAQRARADRQRAAAPQRADELLDAGQPLELPPADEVHHHLALAGHEREQRLRLQR
jgi:hypothetical protein